MSWLYEEKHNFSFVNFVLNKYQSPLEFNLDPSSISVPTMHCVIVAITVFIALVSLKFIRLFSYSVIQPQVCNKFSVGVSVSFYSASA